VIIDPDEQVSAAVAAVFATFTAAGSAYAVVGELAGRPFPRRAYGGAWAGQLRFGSLTHSRVCAILSNPVYASAYVYGRLLFQTHRHPRRRGACQNRGATQARVGRVYPGPPPRLRQLGHVPGQ